MKVVLFCGGLGMRMRDGVTTGPKPMAMVGERPLVWHVMRYYAHFGHKDFIICLGYGTMEDEPMFLANYADVLTNAQLPDMTERFEVSSAMVGLLAVPPKSLHHVVDIDDNGLITQVTAMQDLRQRENGGYFTMRPDIFDHLHEGEDLVQDAIMRLVSQRRVLAYPYKGYWSPADTVKERVQLDEMYHRGTCPWMIWDPDRSGMRPRSAPPCMSPAAAFRPQR